MTLQSIAPIVASSAAGSVSGLATDPAHDRVIFGSELPGRCVSLGDRDRTLREARLHQMFPDLVLHPVSDAQIAFALARRCQDALILITGNDAPRMARLLRDDIQTLARIAKIAVVDDMHPTRRAQLLMAGFDDVWDIGRMQPEEMVARARAVWSRYTNWRGSNEVRNRTREDLQMLARLNELTATERQFLALLAADMSDVVPYPRLCRELGKGPQLMSSGHLKTLASFLRAKLHPHVELVAVPKMGYVLRFRTK
ncbi:MAG: hypothetical protein RIS94_1993 [Pseudomonadota bacterium]|jgi:DNA-binding response OmpR family regulator